MKHILPPLPYDYAALEPYIDAETMKLHHGKHHASYVAKLNEALENLPQLQEHSATWLLSNLDTVPDSSRTAVLNNAGGHVNHSMFWKGMGPVAGGPPRGYLADAINRDFGSFAEFKAKFSEAGGKVFGSGWVWLGRNQQKGDKLVILTTHGHDNPIMQGIFPILVNDVWEHAYYLKYQNRRPDYLEGWWSVVDWQEAGRRYQLSEDAKDISEVEWEDESIGV